MNESRYSTLDRLIRVKNTDGPLTLCIRKIRPGPIRIHLPARAQRLDLSRHATLLAQDRSAFHSACRRRHLEAAGYREDKVTPCAKGNAVKHLLTLPSIVEVLGHFVIITVSPVHVSGTPSFKHCADCTRKCQATLSVGFRPRTLKSSTCASTNLLS